jgi:acyl-CoA synthetase (AMP-forming)/AMP-acid ligase II
VIRSPHPDLDIPDVSLTEFVLGRARELGDRPALVDAASGRVLTYAQLGAAVERVAAGLAELGFGRGDVLAHYAPNLPEYAVAFHAVASLGGVNTTANPLFTADELSTQLSDCSASLLVTVPPLLDKAIAAAERTGVEEVFVYGEAEGATPFARLLESERQPPPVRIDPSSDLVALPYSSGTTGLPKGVMLTHRNLVANICQMVAAHRVVEDDRVIAVLPFFHIYGLVVILNMVLSRGATVVTMPRFELQAFLAALQDHRITRVYVVPPIALALAKHPLVDEYDLSSVAIVLSGAAPLGADIETACGERLGCKIVQGYGMTETSPVTHVVPDDAAGRKPGSIGVPVANTECRLVDLQSDADAAPGERGEVWVRGPQVMRGYLGNPQATADTIDEDGWLHTGDIARVDDDGWFYIVDRLKELIKYKGYQVAPAELEALLVTHPGIADAAVIGIPDEEAGEVPKAFVVAKGSLGPDEVSAFVAERVAPYKKLRAVEMIEEIPKSPSGKVLRRVLVERERGRAAAGAAGPASG